MLSLLEKALSIAARMLYKDRGCMGGNLCDVATTCYSKEKQEQICTRCWKNRLIEMAKDQMEELGAKK